MGGDPVNLVDLTGLCRVQMYARYEAPQGPDGKPSGPWEFKYFYSRLEGECPTPGVDQGNSGGFSDSGGGVGGNSELCGADVICAVGRRQSDGWVDRFRDLYVSVSDGLSGVPRDSQGFSHIGSGIVEPGLFVSVPEFRIRGFSQVKIISRFTTAVQCRTCISPPLGGSYVARFYTGWRNPVGPSTLIQGMLQRYSVTLLPVPAGAYYLQLRPTPLTPPNTLVVVRGK